MSDYQKFQAEILDVKLTVEAANTFTADFINCNAADFAIEKVGDTIKLIQKKRVQINRNWHTWIIEGMCEVKITLPASLEFCRIAAASGIVIVQGLQLKQLEVEVSDGTATAKDVQADEVSLFCEDGIANGKNIIVRKLCKISTDNGVSKLSGKLNFPYELSVVCENGLTDSEEEEQRELYAADNLPDAAAIGGTAASPAQYRVYCENGIATYNLI